jgi:hypothetical protein
MDMFGSTQIIITAPVGSIDFDEFLELGCADRFSQ